ncbi:MAG: WG repeat-containing protein, partial [Pyrinomonadaceae bacterium]
MVIEPKFDWVEDFSEGLALVDLNRTKEFIDETGKVVLVP